MSENNYECPKCHNVFPISNKFMHDIRCTENNPLPLNASRMADINKNGNKKDNKNSKQNQHIPQPKITSKRRPDSHINPFNAKESILEVPETFNCWLCGQTLPEKEREDHMLCHKMQEESEKYKEQGNHKNNQNQRPIHRPPQQQNRAPKQQNRPPQQQNRQPLLQPPKNLQQNRPPIQQPPKNLQQNNKINNINIKRSFVPFDDIDIFDFNQIHESLNKMNNPTDEEILNELPETEIGDVSKLEPERRNCIICLKDLKEGDKATMLPCIHMFHSECIQIWLKTANACPVCKMKLTKEILNH